ADARQRRKRYSRPFRSLGPARTVRKPVACDATHLGLESRPTQSLSHIRGSHVMNDSSGEPRSGLSRPGFLTGTGAAAAALTGLQSELAPAAQPGGGAAPAQGPGPVLIELTVNGKKLSTSVEPRVTLLDALRNYLDVTGCKRVCDRGTCGACTVML